MKLTELKSDMKKEKYFAISPYIYSCSDSFKFPSAYLHIQNLLNEISVLMIYLYWAIDFVWNSFDFVQKPGYYFIILSL